MKTASVLFLAALSAVVSLAGPAAHAQTQPPQAGLFRAVEEGGREVFLVRLELVARTTPLGVVATVFDRTGYSVFAGTVDRGGLNIPFVFLYPARDPYRMLRTPAQLLRNPAASLDTNGLRCQVDLFFISPGQMTYRCPDSSGRLIKLRP